MVKKTASFLAYSLFFILAIIMFVPKESLYFLMEENAKKFDIVISNETLQESAFNLHIQNLELSMKGIESAKIGEADISLLLLFNTVELHDIELSSLVDTFIPAQMKRVEISYTLFNPLIISGQGEGKFGDARVWINLLDRKMTVALHPSKKMLRNYQNSLRLFKKSENGEYIYVKTF